MKASYLLTLALAFLLVTGTRAQNTSAVSQAGEDNTAVVGQSGDENVATVIQGLELGGIAAAEENEAEIQQEGTENEATVNQGATVGLAGAAASGNEALIDQLGTGNEATVNQGAAVGAFAGAVAASNVADVAQEGTDNMATVNQVVSIGIWALATGTANEATVNQKGIGNEATVNQALGAGFDTEVSGIGNEAFVEQIGDGNTTTVSQDGTSNVAEVRIGTTPGTGNDHNARVVQSGGDNVLRFGVEGDGFGAGGPSTLDAWQSGEGNAASGRIDGDENQVTLVQDGDGNRIGSFDVSLEDGVVITGSLNLVDVLQLGTGHAATVTVAGGSNTATVVQQ